MEQRPVCLTVGGSDSCGGAGIQADLRVFETLGIQGCSATTALTAQNPDVIQSIQPSSIDHFTAELHAIFDYYDIACIKTGMLYDEAHLEALMPFIQHIPLIIDPVLISSSGTFLFDKETAKSAYAKLILHATLWTPNLDEATFFLGNKTHDAKPTAIRLFEIFQTPVLLKGGHGNSQQLQDILSMAHDEVSILEHPKQNISNAKLHGTGCRLASAISAHIAKGDAITTAIHHAHSWLQSDLKSR